MQEKKSKSWFADSKDKQIQENEQKRTLDQLEIAYDQTHGGDDYMESNASHADKQLLQAMRLRLLANAGVPGKYIKEQFDDTIERRTEEFPKFSEEEYNSQYQAIADMNEKESQKLYEAMMLAQGHKKSDGGEWIITSRLDEKNATSFAIDSKTLKQKTVGGYAGHNEAAHELAMKIMEPLREKAEMIVKRKLMEEHGVTAEEIRNDPAGFTHHVNQLLKWRTNDIVEGLIVKVPGYDIPLLKLGLTRVPDENMQKNVLDFIKKRKQFIPMVPFTGKTW